jgi:hypothetical protein
MPLLALHALTASAILRSILLFAVGTLCGVLTLLIGHVIFRAAPLSPFDDDRYTLESSMKAGALGGTIMYLPAQALELLINKLGEPNVRADDNEEAATCVAEGSNFQRNRSPLTKLCILFIQAILHLGTAAAFGAGTGAIGTAILRNAQGDNFLPPLYATRAGSIGGAVILLLIVCCGVLFGGTMVRSKIKEMREMREMKDRLATNAPDSTSTTGARAQTTAAENNPETA